MVLFCGVAVNQKFEYFRIQNETFQTIPSFVWPLEKASGKTHKLDFKKSVGITNSRLAGRTEDKMKEMTTEKPLKRMSSKQQVGEEDTRPSVKEGNPCN